MTTKAIMKSFPVNGVCARRLRKSYCSGAINLYTARVCTIKVKVKICELERVVNVKKENVCLRIWLLLDPLL